MSNYIFIAKNKETGKLVKVSALDDYFGRHKYGYKPEDDYHVYDEKQFNDAYEHVVDNSDVDTNNTV